MKKHTFLLCGTIGWCIEIIFTGFCSMLHHDFCLTSKTSLLMFPIYGMASFIKPIYTYIKTWNILARGIFYTIGIFFVEYVTGRLLTRLKICPWNYSHSKYNIHGVIRLDFSPFWFFTGLLYEKILCRNDNTK